VVNARPAEIRAALRPTAAALHQPFGDSVTVPLYLLGQAAAQLVDTVFNGEGGDQLFGGWANKPMIAAEAFGKHGYNREAAYLQTFHRLHGLTDRFYTAAAQHAVSGLEAGAWIRPALAALGFSSLLHRLRAANLWLKGAQNIAPRARQLAAAHGLNLQAPFFDRSLAQWTFTLPPEWLLHGACEKYLLKRAAEPYLPADIVWRGKRGMGVPTTEWCLGPLRRDVGRWLNLRRLQQAGWFEPATVKQLRHGVEVAGDFRSRRIGELLWTLLMLHLWLDVHGQPLTWPTSVERG
jgi:asparagine synthase (glutamine-hydrolysing)